MDRQRLDHYLAKQHPDISRGFLQKLIADDQVLVNGKPEKSGFKLHRDDTVKMLYDVSKIGKVPNIKLPIIYEDENILVVNKPSGTLSHALTKFHNEPSVASFLRQRMNSSPKEDIRFGIVHRLDRLTSGVMICAKNGQVLSDLQKQFAARSVSKEYIAVTTGIPKQEHAIIDLPLERNPKKPATYRVGSNGKDSKTEYRIIRHNYDFALLSLLPMTGRTHQLRVHLKHIGTPIVGDQLYGETIADRLMLHAHKLSVKINGKTTTFEASIPTEFEDYLNVN